VLLAASFKWLTEPYQLETGAVGRKWQCSSLRVGESLECSVKGQTHCVFFIAPKPRLCANERTRCDNNDSEYERAFDARDKRWFVAVAKQLTNDPNKLRWVESPRFTHHHHLLPSYPVQHSHHPVRSSHSIVLPSSNEHCTRSPLFYKLVACTVSYLFRVILPDLSLSRATVFSISIYQWLSSALTRFVFFVECRSSFHRGAILPHISGLADPPHPTRYHADIFYRN